MTEDLKKLREIINNSIDRIIEVCERRGEEFPSLSSPAHPSEFSPNGIRNDPGILDAIALGVSAASQLTATLQAPHVSLISSVTGFNLSATLAVAERTNVAEILREAGPKGLRVEDIAVQSNVDSKKLARILRYLATNHIFKEISPDVFANNSVSSCLDTGKPPEEIKQDPSTKFDNTLGVQAFASFLCDEPFRASAQLSDNITDPLTAFSEEPNAAPMQRAFNTDLVFWELLEKPENIFRFRRLGEAMNGTSATQPPAAILQGFDWSSVPQGGTVVDVGCGIGNVSLEVSRVRPDLKIVLEDRPQVIEKTKAYWNDAAPESINAGSVHFNGFDFFASRPALPGDPSVFLLRTILHDWPDKYSIKLLKNLRSLATPETKLLVVDTIIDHACSVPLDQTIGVPGLEHTDVPVPLLANLGQASVLAYDVDMLMMINLNSSERTLEDFQTIFSEAGWKLTEVRRIPGNKALWPSIIAVPA